MNKPVSDSHELASKPPTNQTHMAGNLIDAATMLVCIFVVLVAEENVSHLP